MLKYWVLKYWDANQGNWNNRLFTPSVVFNTICWFLSE